MDFTVIYSEDVRYQTEIQKGNLYGRIHFILKFLPWMQNLSSGKKMEYCDQPE